jgi:hypothetical protein
MRIFKTKLYFAGEDSVEVFREVTPDGKKLMQYWVPLIKDGVPNTVKPDPLIPSQDHWADWHQLVKKAEKRLAEARKKHSPPRHRITEWTIPKNAVAFFVGDSPGTGEEITKVIRIKDK